MHYVLDLWVHQWRKRHARGRVIVVRYCDDFVMGFQYEVDARRMLGELKERLAKFKLALHRAEDTPHRVRKAGKPATRTARRRTL